MTHRTVENALFGGSLTVIDGKTKRVLRVTEYKPRADPVFHYTDAQIAAQQQRRQAWQDGLQRWLNQSPPEC